MDCLLPHISNEGIQKIIPTKISFPAFSRFISRNESRKEFSYGTEECIMNCYCHENITLSKYFCYNIKMLRHFYIK